MSNALRNLLYPLTLCLMVATLWVYAWQQSLDAELAPGWFPAFDPGLMDRIVEAETATASADLHAL